MSEYSDISLPLVEGSDGKLFWIMEGAAAAYVPEVMYVSQPGKVFFFIGGPQQLHESLVEGQQVVESFDSLDLTEQVIEGGKKVKTVDNATWIVEGIFQRSDVRNANGRIYTRKIWERIIGNPKSRQQVAIRERGMIGHLEHPKDGRTDGNEGSLVVTNMNLKEDGTVWGRAELLDTPKGRILQEYTRKKVRWGVSSRGTGTVDADGKVNETDYEMETVDGVMKPSTPGAYPKPPKTEDAADAEAELNEQQGEKTLTEEAQQYLDTVTALTETSMEGFDFNASHRLASDLLAKAGEADEHVEAGRITDKQASDARRWLFAKLAEAQESIQAGQTEALIESAATDAEGEMDSRIIESVVNPLREQVGDLTTENTTLQERVTAANEARETADALVMDLQEKAGQADEALLRAETAEQSLAVAHTKLQTAEASLAALAEDDDDVTDADAMAQAVAEAIQQQPDLGRFESVLAEAVSPEQVQALSEQLLKPVDPPEEGAASRRTTLPPVGAVLESDAGGATSKPASTSAGARKAGRAVTAMAGKK